jgi:hypothetical protein
MNFACVRVCWRLGLPLETFAAHWMMRRTTGRSSQVMRATAAFRSAPATDQKKQMEGTNLRSLGLSPAQATKANAWIRADPSKALEFLSPSQKAAVSRL